jgi:hypothetical protein
VEWLPGQQLAKGDRYCKKDEANDQGCVHFELPGQRAEKGSKENA